MARRQQYQNTLRALRSYLNPLAFLRWWRDGLLLWLPESLRQHLTAPTPKLLIDVTADELVISAQEAGERRELVRYPRALLADGLSDAPKPRDREVVLRLPADQALSQMITLPQAASKNLRQVVGFELDRLTPFPAQQIYYDAQVLTQQQATRTIRVQFVMALRSVLDPLLDQLSATGLMPDRVTVAGDRGGCNLLSPERRPRRVSVAGTIRGVLWLLILVTGLAVAVLPLWQQRALVVELIPKVQAARQQAEHVAKLRRQLDKANELAHFLPAKRRQEPRVIRVLEQLTRVIPDNTWVEQLEIRGNQLELRGQSQEASALLPLLEQSPLFQGATFRSPITRDARSGKDRFYLTAQIVSPADREAH